MSAETGLQFCLAVVVALATSVCEVRCATTEIPASKDNTIFQNVPNRSAGGSAGIFSGTTGRYSPRRGLMAFDIAASVPANARIIAVELRLYLAATGGSLSQTIGLHRLTKDWGEGNAGSTLAEVRMSGNGFTSSPGDATWNANFLETSLWTSLGATGDFHPDASSTSLVSDAVESPFDWHSTPALVNDVQSWLDHPATNFGWAIINADEVSIATAKAFYSRSAIVDASGELLPVSHRPTLNITYEVPEPGIAAGCTLLLAFFATSRCRRNPLCDCRCWLPASQAAENGRQT